MKRGDIEKSADEERAERQFARLVRMVLSDSDDAWMRVPLSSIPMFDDPEWDEEDTANEILNQGFEPHHFLEEDE